MPAKIRLTDPVGKRIIDTSPTLPRVSPAMVAAALGAVEVPGATLEQALAPITLFAVRSELFGRLQSSGGRPALTGTSRRAKIPLGDAEWEALEKLAALVSGPESSPSAGQIAGVLLSLSVRSVMAQIATSPAPETTALGRDLAARSASEPSGA